VNPPNWRRPSKSTTDPRYAGDALPKTKTGQALALPDKLDTLVESSAIRAAAYGTKDPSVCAGRAGSACCRIILEGGLNLDLPALLKESESAQPVHRPGVIEEVYDFIAERLRGLLLERGDGLLQK